MFFAGCMKDTPNVDFSKIGAIAEISSSNINSTPNAPSSGLDYFNAATTLPYIGADTIFTVTFDVNIASNYPLSKDITVKVAIDDAKRIAYNASNSGAFLAQPDSSYSFPAQSAVIKAGTRIATFTVKYYPQKLDPSLSYMLPITLTDAFVGKTVTFIPDDATTIEVIDSYSSQPRYVLKFTNTNGVLSNFTISQNKKDVAVMTAGGITVTDGPAQSDVNTLVIQDVFHDFSASAGGRTFTGIEFHAKEATVGSPYLFDKWVKGSVINKNDALISNPSYLFNFNKMTGTLLVTKDQKTYIEVDNYIIKSFTLTNEQGVIYIVLPGARDYRKASLKKKAIREALPEESTKVDNYFSAHKRDDINEEFLKGLVIALNQLGQSALI